MEPRLLPLLLLLGSALAAACITASEHQTSDSGSSAAPTALPVLTYLGESSDGSIDSDWIRIDNHTQSAFTFQGTSPQNPIWKVEFQTQQGWLKGFGDGICGVGLGPQRITPGESLAMRRFSSPFVPTLLSPPKGAATLDDAGWLGVMRIGFLVTNLDSGVTSPVFTQAYVTPRLKRMSDVFDPYASTRERREAQGLQ